MLNNSDNKPEEKVESISEEDAVSLSMLAETQKMRNKTIIKLKSSPKIITESNNTMDTAEAATTAESVEAPEDSL